MAELNVVVIGAGIAGLTCAISLARCGSIRVTVLERSPILGDAGNGIQVPCNASHVLRHLGLLDKLLAKAGGPATASLSLDYGNGRVLLTKDYARCEELLAHRSDYIDVLRNEAVELGVNIELGCEVETVDFDAPSVRLADGQVHHGDLIIACDGMPPRANPSRAPSDTLAGLHSKVRSQIHPAAAPSFAGAVAYRVLLDTAQLFSPALSPLATSRVCRLWLGPRAHAVFYPVRPGAILNLVVIVADQALNAACHGPDALTRLREALAPWDPVLGAMLAAATALVRFPLLELQPLPSWSRGPVVLAGDAAHPTLPYLAQGAAMAVEDACILGDLLGRLAQHLGPQAPIKPHLSTVLAAYAATQRPRTAAIVEASRAHGASNHLAPDDPARRARDAEYAAFDMATSTSEDAWLDAGFNREVLGRQAADVAAEVFRDLVVAGAFAG